MSRIAVVQRAPAYLDKAATLALAAAADELVCINRTMHVHGNPDEVVHSHALREAYSCEFNFIAGEIAHHEKLGHPD